MRECADALGEGLDVGGLVVEVLSLLELLLAGAAPTGEHDVLVLGCFGWSGDAAGDLLSIDEGAVEETLGLVGAEVENRLSDNLPSDGLVVALLAEHVDRSRGEDEPDVFGVCRVVAHAEGVALLFLAEFHGVEYVRDAWDLGERRELAVRESNSSGLQLSEHGISFPPRFMRP